MTKGNASVFAAAAAVAGVFFGTIFGWTTARDATIRQCDTIGVFMFGTSAFDCSRKTVQ